MIIIPEDLGQPVTQQQPQTVLRFEVFGRPEPQGSSRAFVLERLGQRPRAIVTSDNKNLKSWRQELAQAASIAALECPRQLPIGSKLPVALYVTFYFAPLKAKRSSRWKTTRPDLDKLLRAICDGITGSIITDDAQVCLVASQKKYDPQERVEIEVALC